MFNSMEQYHFEREDFCNAFNEVFTSDQYGKLFDLMTRHDGYRSYKFILTRHDDDFYILDTETGLLITWYKHLGRINMTNDKALTLDELKQEFTKLKQDLEENNALQK